MAREREGAGRGRGESEQQKDTDYDEEWRLSNVLIDNVIRAKARYECGAHTHCRSNPDSQNCYPDGVWPSCAILLRNRGTSLNFHS
ncbi:hypothetical protein GCM10009820_13250 [Leifsonia soli]